MEPEKAGLLTEVAVRNRPFLLGRSRSRDVWGLCGHPLLPHPLSLLLLPGLPAGAPTRPGRVLLRTAPGVEPYGRVLNELDLAVDNLYVGGTPTVLGAFEWEQLLDVLNRYYLGTETEFTVEAGRPDTLNGDVLRLLVAGGVNRMCVNPQTMNDETLNLIGRRHTAQMVRSGYELVRSAGIKQVKMYLI